MIEAQDQVTAFVTAQIAVLDSLQEALGRLIPLIPASIEQAEDMCWTAADVIKALGLIVDVSKQMQNLKMPPAQPKQALVPAPQAPLQQSPGTVVYAQIENVIQSQNVGFQDIARIIDALDSADSRVIEAEEVLE